MRTWTMVAFSVFSASAFAGVLGTGGTVTSSPTGEIVHMFMNNGTFSTPYPGKVKILLEGGGKGGDGTVIIRVRKPSMGLILIAK